MGGVSADVGYAVRSWRRQPVLAVTAVVTLALGIGANTAIFSVVNVLLLKPLPYEDAERLVVVWSAYPERGWDDTDVSLADAWDWRSGTTALADLAVFTEGSVNLTGGAEPERLSSVRTTPNLMKVLGVAPGLGRDLEPDDNVPGAAGTALLSYGFWQRRFGGDADIVGRVLTLDGEPHRVVGIMPAGFRFMAAQPDLWRPYRLDPAEARRDSHSHQAVARLAPGATVNGASREVAQVAESLAEAFPDTNRGWTAYAVPLKRELLGSVGFQTSVLLMAVVGFVLLMACVNVANLLLARANARRREMAVRFALGAGRGRLARQLMAECLVLGLAGGAVGLTLAVWGERTLVAALPDNVPDAYEFGIDGTVLGFALLLSLLATLVFGVVPSLRASRATGLELQQRAGHRRGAYRFGGALVVAQTALAALLLVGAGVMARSVVAMQRLDLGFRPENVLTLRIDPSPARYETPAEALAFFEEAEDRLAAVPGVEAVGSVHRLPLSGFNWVQTYQLAGSGQESRVAGRMSIVSAGYFDAIGARVLQGRLLRDSDGPESPDVVVVNETMARRHLGPQPLGRSLVDDDGNTSEVVGVVSDLRERNITEPVEPAVYFPVRQTMLRSRTVVLRAAVPPTTLAAAVRRAVWQVDPDQPVYAVRPLTAVLDTRFGTYRFLAYTMIVFAAISLLLGAVGIYGVMAYGVGRRTMEIGLRLAVGAQRERVVRMIVWEGLGRALLGLAVGLVAGLGLTRLMAGLLVGISPTDPLSFGAVFLLLTLVTGLSSYLPARRASRVDPVRALAHE